MLLACAVLTAATLPAAAQDATWTGAGAEWTTGGNWSSASVPSGTATFTNNGAPAAVTISSSTSIDEISFTAAAPAYSFTVQGTGTVFSVNGIGIVNNSLFAPSFTIDARMDFNNASTADNASITNNIGGNIVFSNTSTAGSATITNNIGGNIVFSNTSTAGSATITNNGAINFNDTSTAGSAAITNTSAIYFNNSSTAGSATIANSFLIYFNDSSTAGSATITNTSDLFFTGSGTAGSATITNNSGGIVDFINTSTAGSASITNNSGGNIVFINTSTAGSATITNNSGGVVDFSTSTGPAGDGNLSAGSIAGAGNFYLGADQLTVGGNNLSTTVSGIVSDCGASGTACQESGSGGTTGGSLVKVGTGTLTLTGPNTYTGATTIDGGTLEVDGSIASSVVLVNAGGTLAGIGTVDPNTVTIASNGTLAPGTPGVPGTFMTITGNLAFQSGASYQVYLNPTTSTFATVTGTASLTGTVNAIFATGSYVQKQYTILQSSGLGGTTFASLQSTNLPTGLEANLDYTTDDVLLDLIPVLGFGSGLNVNQQNVANALNNYFNNGGTLPPAFVNIFGLSGLALPNALTQLDGEDATGAQKSAFQLMTEFLNLMLGPSASGGNGSGGGGANGFAPDDEASLPPDVALAYNRALKKPPPQPAAFDQRWSAWGSAFGGSSTTDGNATIGSNNVTASDYGFAAGMTYHVTPATEYGFALAGGGTNWSVAQNLGSGRSDAFQAGVYSTTHFGAAYLSGALAFANHWFTTGRIAMGDQLTAKFDGQSYAARVEAGYRYGLPATGYIIGVTPYAALQVQDFHTPGYTETDLSGGGFGLTYNAMSATDTRSELGARFDNLTTFDGMPLVLRGRLAWAHDWVSNSSLSAVFQVLPGSSFTVNGAAPPANSALTTAAAELHLTANWTAMAKFDGEFAPGSQTYAGTGTLKYTW